MNRWWAAALPLGAAAMVGAALLVPSGSPATSDPRRVEVGQASYACPAGPIISMAAGQLKAGASREVRLGGGSPAQGALDDAGRWQSDSFDARGVIVTATGDRVGPAGFFSGTAPKAGGGGLVVGRCPGAVDDAWFVGAGSGDEHFSTLILTNLASTPAVADVKLWGTEGPVEAIDGSGITLDPYEVRRIRVADLAAGEPDLAIQVQRTRGSMAAVVNDSSSGDLGGTEPIGSTLSPRREQVVGGVTGGKDDKTLQLLNPGERTARVDVEVLAGSGTFAGKGLQGLKVEPGRLREVQIPASAGGGRQAYRLTSDVPVAASVRSSPTGKDYAIAEASRPLDGSALVPLDLGDLDDVPDLVLTAPERNASVQVDAFDDRMRPLGSQTLEVKAGTTGRFPAVDPDDDAAEDAAYVVVRARGEVLGAARYTDGDRLSSLALEAADVSVAAPAVRRDD